MNINTSIFYINEFVYMIYRVNERDGKNEKERESETATTRRTDSIMGARTCTIR